MWINICTRCIIRLKSEVIVSKFQISYTILADMHNLLDIYRRDILCAVMVVTECILIVCLQNVFYSFLSGSKIVYIRMQQIINIIWFYVHCTLLKIIYCNDCKSSLDWYFIEAIFRYSRVKCPGKPRKKCTTHK